MRINTVVSPSQMCIQWPGRVVPAPENQREREDQGYEEHRQGDTRRGQEDDEREDEVRERQNRHNIAKKK